jgi:protein SCO1/2
MTMTRRCLVARSLAAACVAVAPGLSSAPAWAHGSHEHAPAPWPAGSSGYQRSVRSYSIPDVVLVDADARRVRLRDLLAADEPVMVNFIFTTCTTICPVMTRVFGELPSYLGDAAAEVRLVSISIDPENDTPATLKSYAKQFGAGKRWSLLTGRVEDINDVQRAFGTYTGDKMSHEPLTLMRSGRGKQWVRIDGFASPDQLAGEYRRMMQGHGGG